MIKSLFILLYLIFITTDLYANQNYITSKEFIRHVGFLDESLKALLYEDMGYDHPLGELIKYLISATKTKDNEKVYTSFRGDKMIDILEYLNGDKDE